VFKIVGAYPCVVTWSPRGQTLNIVLMFLVRYEHLSCPLSKGSSSETDRQVVYHAPVDANIKRPRLFRARSCSCGWRGRAAIQWNSLGLRWNILDCWNSHGVLWNVKNASLNSSQPPTTFVTYRKKLLFWRAFLLIYRLLEFYVCQKSFFFFAVDPRPLKSS